MEKNRYFNQMKLNLRWNSRSKTKKTPTLTNFHDALKKKTMVAAIRSKGIIKSEESESSFTDED